MKQNFPLFPTKKEETLDKSWLDNACEPWFLLNLDRNLSIYYANAEFYDTFETTSETFAKLYSNCLRYALTFQDQEKHKQKLPQNLEFGRSYHDEVEIITATGTVRTLSFRVIRQKIDETGEKLLGFFHPVGEGCV